MAIATFKDLCIDVQDRSRAGAFWAHAFGLSFDGTCLRGPSPRHTVWLNEVPEPRTVKNRIHIDVHTGDVSALVAAGARVLDAHSYRWTVMADPEGQEFCAFVRERPPPIRLYELGVDCADPIALSRWWGEVFGVEHHLAPTRDWCWLEEVPGMPWDSITFAPVPEPKLVKNRVHWGVLGDGLGDGQSARAALVRSGARLLSPHTAQRPWDVLADPEGNEFCVFPAADRASAQPPVPA